MEATGASFAFTVFFAAIFTNNILLTNFLGMCSFLSISKEIKTSVGLGIAVVFVMAATSVLNYLVYYFILIPLELTYLRYIVFIIIIAAFVQLVEMVIERVSEPPTREPPMQAPEPDVVGTWSVIEGPSDLGLGHITIHLVDGRVLVVGGTVPDGEAVKVTAAIFDHGG